MGLDLKIPIGLMFTILGILLIFEGFSTYGDSIYEEKSLGYNINLWSGFAMLFFGMIMLFLSFMTRKREIKKDHPDQKTHGKQISVGFRDPGSV